MPEHEPRQPSGPDAIAAKWQQLEEQAAAAARRRSEPTEADIRSQRERELADQLGQATVARLVEAGVRPLPIWVSGYNRAPDPYVPGAERLPDHNDSREWRVVGRGWHILRQQYKYHSEWMYDVPGSFSGWRAVDESLMLAETGRIGTFLHLETMTPTKKGGQKRRRGIISPRYEYYPRRDIAIFESEVMQDALDYLCATKQTLTIGRAAPPLRQMY